MDGAIRPKELAQSAAERGQSFVALTDQCGLYGAVELHKYAGQYGVRPIYGSVVWLEHKARSVTRREGLLEVTSSSAEDGGAGITLLAKDATGYRNLCKIISSALERIQWRPRAPLDVLRAHSDGLIALVGAHTQLVRSEELPALLSQMQEIFGGDNVYGELTDNGLPGQRDRADAVAASSAELGLRIVATNDVRYVDPHDAVSLDVMHAIKLNREVDEPRGGRLITDQKYLKTEEEMLALGFPREAVVTSPAEIADRCRHTLSTGVFRFPVTEPPEDLGGDPARRWRWMQNNFPLPPHAAGCKVEPPDSYHGEDIVADFFGQYARLGLSKRLRGTESSSREEYSERLEYEIEVICRMGFPAYMLIVAEFINWSKQQGIPVGPGRGSVAGSLVAWSMGISNLDPIRFNLIFERFLNPGRQSMPDVDVDFSRVRRAEAIHHVEERYGRDCVAQIATLMGFKPKIALKDVCRAIGVPFTRANEWSKAVDDKAKKLQDSINLGSIAAQIQGDPQFSRAWKLASKLQGNLRQTGVHAAGVVITDKALTEYVPTAVDPESNVKTVCADMDSVDTQGLIKFDFLGLVTLDIIKTAVGLIKESTGREIDIDEIPLDDEATYAMLQRGDTLGTFQLESSGMRELIRQLCPTNIEHIIALVALYRPGPLQSGLVDKFVECRHGRAEVTYLWPTLEPILSTTYGAIVYQEQVLQIARDLAGFSMSEADLMRRAIGKKKAEEMQRQRVKFVDGCVDNGVDKEVAEELFGIIDYFSGYSFNRSHSAAYGLISYMTAWLKANYPRELMASVLSWESSEAKLSEYVKECRAMGIKVLPPDINLSRAEFTLEGDDAIRFGLLALKGLGDKAVRELLRVRARGPFTSLQGLQGRTRLTKTYIEALAYSGALDSFGEPRERILSIMKPPAQNRRGPAAGQVLLFGGGATVAEKEELEESGAFFGWKARMKKELHHLGTWISGHPIDLYGQFVPKIRDVPLGSAGDVKAGRLLRVAGVVTAIKKVTTFRKEEMAFVTLSDETGWIEAVAFSRVWEGVKRIFEVGDAIVCELRIEQREDERSYHLGRVKTVDDHRQDIARGLRVCIRSDSVWWGQIPKIQRAIEESSEKRSSNRVPVELRLIDEESGSITVAWPDSVKVSVTAELVDALEACRVHPADIEVY